MKILLAIDGSPCSDAAVAEVSRRPWPEGSSIKVLTTFELPTPPTPEGWALPRFLLGSVSQSVVSHAKCSVEVVRCRSVVEQAKDKKKEL
jgi:nucleotide-binding universal stress UspA family protein